MGRRRLPAQKSGGLYNTCTDEDGFVAAVPSRVFRDGTGIFTRRLTQCQGIKSSADRAKLC
jgi:hypothetical protein